MYAKVNSLGLFGLNAFPVDVEIETSKGTPSFDIIGLADTAIKESRERIRSALRASLISFPLNKIIVNLAPADTKKTGSIHDLAIFTALLCVTGNVPADISKSAFIGEVSLNGDVRGVNGVLPMVLLAKKEGFGEVFVPEINAYEASVVEGIKVYGVKNTAELIKHFDGSEPLTPQDKYIVRDEQRFDTVDFADVKGQQQAKKALEIAAAGGHNLLMIGAPGSGKSMMAKRLPSILPPLSLSESLETTQIHSVAGKLKRGTSLISQRPFRSPHHTISEVALVGGGINPQPGEISLAHNGVLFADELPEFNKQTLEVLRQPLEDHKITISRSKYTVEFPCSFMFIASMNPCPCGYYNDPTHRCCCTPGQIQRYMNKISGPLLDRIDIQCEITPVPFKDISQVQPGEPSAAIRERVIKAREIQTARFKDFRGIHCNAQMTERMIHQFAEPDEASINLLRTAMEKFSLSARAYNRILKVARTIADLDGAECVGSQHIAEAICYRNLDRGDWAERRLY